MKLFAFDMDGTILDNHERILPETLEQIRKAREKGHKAVIATGRPYEDIIRSLDENEFDYLIANNGAYFYDVKNKKFHYVNGVNKKVLDDVIEIGKEHDCYLAIHGETMAIRASLGSNEAKWDNPEFHEFSKFKDTFLSEKEAREFAASQKVMQISLRQTSEVINKIEGFFEKYRDIVNIHIANDVYLDINPKDIDKFGGIKRVLELEDKEYEIYAFGDSSNDLQMLEGAHQSYAMENGNIFAKEAATEVIGPNNEPSIAKKLVELI